MPWGKLSLAGPTMSVTAAVMNVQQRHKSLRCRDDHWSPQKPLQKPHVKTEVKRPMKSHYAVCLQPPHVKSEDEDEAEDEDESEVEDEIEDEAEDALSM